MFENKVVEYLRCFYEVKKKSTLIISLLLNWYSLQIPMVFLYDFIPCQMFERLQQTRPIDALMCGRLK